MNPQSKKTKKPPSPPGQAEDVRNLDNGLGHPDDGNFSQFSNKFIDFHMDYLSGNAVKVMNYILRRTCGFQKSNDAISYDQLGHGIVTREGKILDKGTGLKVNPIKRAVAELEEAGLLFVHQRKSRATGEWLPNVYEPNLLGYPRFQYAHDEIDPRAQTGGPNDPDQTGMSTVDIPQVEQKETGQEIRPVAESHRGGISTVDIPTDNSKPEVMHIVDNPHVDNPASTTSPELEVMQNLQGSGMQKMRGFEAKSFQKRTIDSSVREPSLQKMKRDGMSTVDKGVYPPRTDPHVHPGQTPLSTVDTTKERIKTNDSKNRLQNKEGESPLTDVSGSAPALRPSLFKNELKTVGQVDLDTPVFTRNNRPLSYDEVIPWLFNRYHVLPDLETAGTAARYAQACGITPERLDAVGQEARKATQDDRVDVFVDLLNKERFAVVDIKEQVAATG